MGTIENKTRYLRPGVKSLNKLPMFSFLLLKKSKDINNILPKVTLQDLMRHRKSKKVPEILENPGGLIKSEKMSFAKIVRCY